MDVIFDLQPVNFRPMWYKNSASYTAVKFFVEYIHLFFLHSYVPIIDGIVIPIEFRRWTLLV